MCRYVLKASRRTNPLTRTAAQIHSLVGVLRMQSSSNRSTCFSLTQGCPYYKTVGLRRADFERRSSHGSPAAAVCVGLPHFTVLKQFMPKT